MRTTSPRRFPLLVATLLVLGSYQSGLCQELDYPATVKYRAAQIGLLLDSFRQSLQAGRAENLQDVLAIGFLEAGAQRSFGRADAVALVQTLNQSRQVARDSRGDSVQLNDLSLIVDSEAIAVDDLAEAIHVPVVLRFSREPRLARRPATIILGEVDGELRITGTDGVFAYLLEAGELWKGDRN